MMGESGTAAFTAATSLKSDVHDLADREKKVSVREIFFSTSQSTFFFQDARFPRYTCEISMPSFWQPKMKISNLKGKAL